MSKSQKSNALSRITFNIPYSMRTNENVEFTIMKEDIVIIHGERLGIKEFEGIINSCRAKSWNKQIWVSKPALIFRSGTVLKFVGQDYDHAEATSNEKAWEHDHCEICGWMLNE